MSIYVTGDTHGDRQRFTNSQFFDDYMSEDDYLMICGDFGFIFDNNESEWNFLKFMAQKPYTILFVDGNHENFDVINAMPVEEWHGGKVHVVARDEVSQSPKVIHLMRGQIFEIEGSRFFTFGGAYSVDKLYRREHISWWPQEMPTNEEIDEALDNLEQCGNKVDYIITHAAPEDTMSQFHPNHINEKHLNNFLEQLLR